MNNSILDDFKRIFFGDNPLSKIILINAIVFVLFNILDYTPLRPTLYFALPGDIMSYLVLPWTVLTYMFLHAGFMHILFNMLWLYWMGKILIEYLGSNRFIAIYLLGGLAGGITFLMVSSFYTMGSFLVGASAGVMAVVAATATQLPDYRMHLLFIGPVKLKYLALGMLVLTSLLNIADNTGGKVAHLGGALLGYVFIKQLQNGNDWSSPVTRILNSIQSLFTKKKKMKVVYKSSSKRGQKASKAKKSSGSSYHNMTNKQKQRYTDHILDKIAKAGYDSLTEEEKEFLFKVSNSD